MGNRTPPDSDTTRPRLRLPAQAQRSPKGRLRLYGILKGDYGFTEERTDGRRVGEYGVPREPQALERALPRPLIPCPARVLYNHGYVAKVGTVAYRRFDPDLRGDPADRERIY